jgi:uncharacterized protein
MNKIIYKNRIADSILQRKLQSSGAVLIEGPKWCGKTTTAEQQAGSINYISDPANINRNLILADMNINALLEGTRPLLLDEWQEIPQLWDAVRHSVDKSNETGQFILTGSAVPLSEDEQKKIHHTGTGRITPLKMRPMSLFESGESNGQISLKHIFDNAPKTIFGECKLTLDDIAYLICRGGWPFSIGLKKENSLDTAYSYYEAVTGIDITRVDGIRRNPSRAKRLMRSLARHQGSQVSISGIKADMSSNDTDSLDEDTVSSYIEALKKLFVIEDMESWNPNLRSKAAIRTSDTRYFTDPSIAVAALGAGPEDLTEDLNTMGLYFESLAVRDLRTYADALSGNVYHYRDSNGLECDSVIHLRNGKYALVEIKLGGEKLVEEGAASLKRLADNLDTTRMAAPSFLMVLVAVGSMAYKRADGVYVVPIGCLKP